MFLSRRHLLAALLAIACLPAASFAQDKAGDKPNEMPRANQLYKSGDIEAHAAVVWLLHRPWAVDKTWPDPTEAAFVLDKVRGGAPGTVAMTWCGPSEAYLDPVNQNQL